MDYNIDSDGAVMYSLLAVTSDIPIEICNRIIQRSKCGKQGLKVHLQFPNKSLYYLKSLQFLFTEKGDELIVNYQESSEPTHVPLFMFEEPVRNLFERYLNKLSLVN
jgi:hypothetical protein